MPHNQFGQNNRIPHTLGNQTNRATRLDGHAKNRGIKNTKKPSKGK